MLLSKCDVCDNKKSTFIKEQEVNGMLSSLATTHWGKLHYWEIFCFKCNLIVSIEISLR